MTCATCRAIFRSHSRPWQFDAAHTALEQTLRLLLRLGMRPDDLCHALAAVELQSAPLERDAKMRAAFVAGASLDELALRRRR